MLLAHRLHTRAGTVELCQRRPPPEAVAQSVVVLLRPCAIQCLQEFDDLQVVVDIAAIRKFEAPLLDPARECGERLVGRTNAEQRLRLLEEALVVPDKVENDEVLLSSSLSRRPRPSCCRKRTFSTRSAAASSPCRCREGRRPH